MVAHQTCDKYKDSNGKVKSCTCTIQCYMALKFLMLPVYRTIIIN